MLKNHGKSSVHVERGQSLVEFALVLPLVVLILAGIFDLGRAFYASITITNSARSGARYFVLYHSTDPNATQNTCNATIAEASSSNLTVNYSDVTISCGASATCVDPLLGSTPTISCSSHQSVIVSIDYLYDDMIFKFFFPTGIDMQRKIEMLIP